MPGEPAPARLSPPTIALSRVARRPSRRPIKVTATTSGVFSDTRVVEDAKRAHEGSPQLRGALGCISLPSLDLVRDARIIELHWSP
jgi:hypothetical protein